jgi:hypothetical protein
MFKAMLFVATPLIVFTLMISGTSMGAEKPNAQQGRKPASLEKPSPPQVNKKQRKDRRDLRQFYKGSQH